MALRKRLARTIAATIIVFCALTAVGITAPADAPFTIAIHAVLENLGVDVDVKVLTLHWHVSWSALSASSTKISGPTF